MSALDLSRLQFALTTIFHIIFPILSIGLLAYLVFLEAAWLKTGKEIYYRHTRFWARILALNFAVGVVTGLTLEFEFGTNFAPFSTAVGGFFGNILGFEGAMAFMLEAGFIGIMLFGWNKVPPALHFLSTGMVAVGATLSAFWIMVANAWMQTPAGGTFEGGKFVVDNYWDAVFNPDFPVAFAHMYGAALETTLFVVGGISAWYLLRKRHGEFFRLSFRHALVAALLIVPLQIVLGDASGLAIRDHQPAKLAAIEAHWHTNPPGTGAPWHVLAWPNTRGEGNAWQLSIPDALSLITTHSLHGQVKGLQDIPPGDRPPIALPFYSFRIMVAIGFYLLALTMWGAYLMARKRLFDRPALLKAWLWAAPLGYIATEMGWITREVGRQPWVVYGLIRTSDAASALPATAVWWSLALYVILYTVLGFAFALFLRRIIRRGPDLESPVPATSSKGRPKPDQGGRIHAHS